MVGGTSVPRSGVLPARRPRIIERQTLEKPTTLSYSSIALFRQCPTAWKARYIDKIKEAPGGAAKFGNDFDTEIAYGLGLVPMDRNGIAVARPQETEKLKAAVEAYREFEESWLATKPEQEPKTQVKVHVTPEQWAEVAGQYGANPVMPFNLVGFADFTRLAPDGVRLQVLDLKTRDRLEFKPEFNIQVGFYAAILGASECSIHVIALGAKKPRVAAHNILVPVNKEFMRHTLDWYAYYAGEIKRMLDAEHCDDLPREAGYHCSWCPLLDKCGTAMVRAG